MEKLEFLDTTRLDEFFNHSGSGRPPWAQQFHSTLVTSLIDDSDGHWQITEAHLYEMYESLPKTPVPRHERKDFVHKLQEFRDHKGDY